MPPERETSTIGRASTDRVERLDSAKSEGGTTMPRVEPPAAAAKVRLTPQQATLRWVSLIAAVAITALGVWLWMPPLWFLGLLLWAIFGMVIVLQHAQRRAQSNASKPAPHAIER